MSATTACDVPFDPAIYRKVASRGFWCLRHIDANDGRHYDVISAIAVACGERPNHRVPSARIHPFPLLMSLRINYWGNWPSAFARRDGLYQLGLKLPGTLDYLDGERFLSRFREIATRRVLPFELRRGGSAHIADGLESGRIGVRQVLQSSCIGWSSRSSLSCLEQHQDGLHYRDRAEVLASFVASASHLVGDPVQVLTIGVDAIAEAIDYGTRKTEK